MIMCIYERVYQMFEKIEIKRDKKIKRLKIEVKEGGALLISAPAYLSESKCIDFANANVVKLSKMIERQRSFDAKKAELDGHFLYLGSKTPISFNPLQRRKYIFEDGALSLSKKEHFREFLRDEAKRVITQKTENIANFYGITYEKLFFRDTKSRWGSCSAKKTLNFSIRLVGAPKSVIEYVIIHEICHLKEFNHSSHFWARVAALSPTYKESEKWLKENGRLLFIY